MVSEDVQQILDIKVKYEDAIYGIIRYKEKIDQLKQSIKDLQQQEKDNTIGDIPNPGKKMQPRSSVLSSTKATKMGFHGEE